MPLRSLLLALFVSLLLPPYASRADTLTLKSGEKIEGKVIKETATGYTIEYKVTASITDTRDVLKSDVAKVDKVTPDELAYQAIKNVKPGPNSLDTQHYEGAMRVLQSFLDQYPTSPHAAEVIPVLAAFSADKIRTDGGEIKIEGKWISREEAQKDQYQIRARALFAQLQDTARRGDLIGAMNLFDQFEKNYPGALVFPDAVGVALQVLPKLKMLAEQTQQAWKVQEKEREAQTQLMSEPQRSETIAAQKRELAQLDSALESTQKSGAKWPALQRHDKTLTALVSKSQSELTRVERLPVARMRESIEAVSRAQAKLAAHDEEGALPELKQATTAWSANEVAQRLKKELDAQRVAAARATPTPIVVAAAATPVAATPRERATPPPAVHTPPPPMPEEEKSFLSSPLGLGVIAVAVLGLGLAYFKMKKKQGDQ